MKLIHPKRRLFNPVAPNAGRGPIQRRIYCYRAETEALFLRRRIFEYKLYVALKSPRQAAFIFFNFAYFSKIYINWSTEKIFYDHVNIAPVYLLSNFHLGERNHNLIGPRDKPAIVRLYNYSMNGVELFDRLCFHYSIDRNTKKWTSRAIENCLSMSLTKARAIYAVATSQNRKTYSVKLFVKDLLMAEYKIDKSSNPLAFQ